MKLSIIRYSFIGLACRKNSLLQVDALSILWSWSHAIDCTISPFFQKQYLLKALLKAPEINEQIPWIFHGDTFLVTLTLARRCGSTGGNTLRSRSGTSGSPCGWLGTSLRMVGFPSLGSPQISWLPRGPYFSGAFALSFREGICFFFAQENIGNTHGLIGNWELLHTWTRLICWMSWSKSTRFRWEF